MPYRIPSVLSVFVLAAGPAFGQAPPPVSTPPSAVASPPATTANCAPTEAAPSQGTITAPTGQRTEPLGDRLARSDGVLCPPTGVDPDIRAPTPSTGSSMPVIPPPGSAAGDPVRPK